LCLYGKSLVSVSTPNRTTKGSRKKATANRTSADISYASSHLRLVVARSMEEKTTLRRFLRLL
jgi:hypothetical protein